MLAEIAYFSKNLLSLYYMEDKQHLPQKPGFWQNLNELATFFIAFLAIFSAGIYFIYRLNLAGIILAIFLSIISLIFLKKRLLAPSEQAFSTKRSKPINLSILITYLVLAAATVFELFSARSDRSLISPWEVVHNRFFFFYLLASLALLIIVTRLEIKRRNKLLFVSIHYLIGLAVAAIVYKIGYGFDPFIHQAAMETIAKQGVIHPKTPYYLGQYGLIVSSYKLFGLPISFLGRWLVPLVAAWLLPTAVLGFFEWLRDKTEGINTKINEKVEAVELVNQTTWLATIFTLAFSLPLFIMTTPQNLSYIFVLLAIISGLKNSHPAATAVFSFAAAAIHPLAGLPALAWTAWLFSDRKLKHLNKNLQRKIKTGIFLGGALLLPLALFIASGGRLKNIKLSFSAIFEISKELFRFGLAGQEDWLLNVIYLLEKNWTAIFLIFVSGGLIYFFRRLSKNPNINLDAWQGLIAINVSLIIAFFLSSQVAFSQLIAYEQTDYAKRIIITIALFISPFLAIGLFNFLNRIANDSRLANKIIWLLVGLGFLAISLYLAYPRFDKYFNSRGYSTDRLDIKAVQLIANQAQGNYIVLANQQVSAAALNSFGFNHYHETPQGPIYFYPIPTGGELYNYYLSMVYESPSRKTMLAAMDLANVNEAYLVVNKYWHESSKIIQAAKLSANNWQEVGNKEIFIFHYQR